MKRTQKLILLMAILVMAFGGLNAARYELRFSLNFTEEYDEDTYNTQLRVYNLGWGFVGMYDFPHTVSVENEGENTNFTPLYGNYQADQLQLELDLCDAGRWVFKEEGCNATNIQINSANVADIEWQEDDQGNLYKDFVFDWCPFNQNFILNVNAYKIDGTPYAIDVSGPNEWASGETYYQLATDGETHTCEDLFGDYVVQETDNPCEYWDENRITIDQYTNWEPFYDDAKKGPELWWVYDLNFELRNHEDGNWIISAVDCVTGAPIAGATVWYDPDCEGEAWVVGETDENGTVVFTNPPPSKGGGFNDPSEAWSYPGPGCYYLEHPSYLGWDPEIIQRTDQSLPLQCSFTEFCGTRGVPVELSSFTAAISAMNNVALSWVTQTETGMRGYYIHRAEANELASAQIVSPLIVSQNSSQQQSYYYEDAELMDSGTYYYWLEASDLDGSSSYHGPVSVLFNAIGDNPSPGIPLVTQLHSVYPNPFNPMAFIPFSLAKDSAVDFKIYNSRGQLVKQFDVGVKAAGMHRISWDGTDYNGKILSNGVYNIVMSAGKDSYQTKAVLLK